MNADAPADAAPAADAPAPVIDDASLIGGAPAQADAAETEDEAGPADVDGDEAADAASGPPETYALTPPAGTSLDEGMLAAVTPVFRDLGLDNAQAQSLTDAYARDVLPRLVEQINGRAQQQVIGDIVRTRAQWAEQFKADPEIGGSDEERLSKLSVMAKAIDSFGGPEDGRELRQLLNDTGLGNNPVIGRLLYRVGLQLGEAQVHHGEGGSLRRSSEAGRRYGEAYLPPDQRNG